MELHMSCHNLCSLHRVCKSCDVHAVEARVGPSTLVKIWVWMMSEWTAVIDVAVVAPPGFKEVVAIFAVTGVCF